MDYTERAIKAFSGHPYACELTGIKIDKVEDDHARCSMVVEPKHLNANGTVMGGALFTLADFCFGIAATYPKPSKLVTLSCSMNFIRPAYGPVVYADARCVKNGRTVCFFRVEITDGEGKILAAADVNGYRLPEPLEVRKA